MLITTFFTEYGEPKTGLTPTISIWDITGTLIIDNVSMTEIAGGFYKYDFSTYDDTVDYVIRADGGESLNISDRYISSSNEIGLIQTDTNNILTNVGAVKTDTENILTNVEILDTDLGTANTNIELVLKIEKNKWVIEDNKLKMYDDDDTSIIYEFDLFDDKGRPTMRNVMKRIPVE